MEDTNDDTEPTLSELLAGKKTKAYKPKSIATKSEVAMKSVSTYTTIGSNNLMNIRHSKNQTWMGEIGNKGGFVIFEKPEYSIRAFYKILNSYVKQGADTLDKIANKYAPRSDGNNPDTYIRLSKEILNANKVTIPKDGKVSYSMYPYLAKVFYRIESGLDEPVDYFSTIYKTYM